MSDQELLQTLIRVTGRGDRSELERLLVDGAPLNDAPLLQAALEDQLPALLEWSRLFGSDAAPDPKEAAAQAARNGAKRGARAADAEAPDDHGTDEPGGLEAEGVERTASPEGDGYEGEALLHQLLEQAPWLVAVLVRRGADPDQRDAHGRTLLHRAAEAGNLELVEALLDAGADPNVTDADGRTPLHLVGGAEAPEIIERLIHGGADPNMRDGLGRSARDTLEETLDGLPGIARALDELGRAVRP